MEYSFYPNHLPRERGVGLEGVIGRCGGQRLITSWTALLRMLSGKRESHWLFEILFRTLVVTAEYVALLQEYRCKNTYRKLNASSRSSIVI